MPGDGSEDRGAWVVGWCEEVDREAVVEEADGVVLVCFVGEGVLDFDSGRITSGVVDAVRVVSAFASWGECVGAVFVEACAPLDEFVDEVWAVGADEIYRCWIAHPSACGECVLDVRCDGIVVGVLVFEDRGDAALRPVGVGGVDLVFGADDDLSSIRGGDRGAESSDS